jgi:hypothetical protein
MIPLPRLQLFEFNDAYWAPRPLRDTVIESLSRALSWGRMLSGLVAPFEEFVARAGVTEVLDVCAGAGGPAAILAAEIRRAGREPPRFILTDLNPQPEAWTALAARAPADLAFEPAPVDATRIPPALARGRARVIMNAMHHFPPALAAGMLADAAAGSAGVFVAEQFERNPLGFVSMMPVGVLALMANPLLTRRDRLAKLLLSLSPVVPMVALWDGMVSALRMYNRAELEAMAAPLGAFEWTWGTFAWSPGGRGSYFYGVPRARARDAG